MRSRASGISFTMMTELGDGPDARRALCELNEECSADIPGRGPFHSFDEYVRRRIEVLSYDPRGVVIARDGDGRPERPRRRTTGRRDSCSTR
ncbi:hypothetical protein [Streptomyces sp. NPDC002587]